MKGDELIEKGSVEKVATKSVTLPLKVRIKRFSYDEASCRKY